MKTFSLIGLIGLARAGQDTLPQHVIGQDTCDQPGQDILYGGMCECEESCCASAEPQQEGCPVDIVLAIDMCSCNNDTWHDMKEFTKRAVNALHTQFGISDSENSGRIAIYQFMEDVSDVVGLETFTNKEIMKKVNQMGNSQFHGYGTDMTKAINHGSQILKNSPRRNMDGVRQVFAVITNGYSDDAMTTDQEVLMAITSGFDNTPNGQVSTVFVAREDSSVKNARGTHTNEEVRDMFNAKLRLKDPVAPQQLIGDIECDEAPEPDYHRECACKCDVPMGCHGIQGEAGAMGEEGPDGCIGDLGKQGQPGQPGDDGPMGPPGDMGGCGMPGIAGQKGEPGDDGVDGIDGVDGPGGIVGPQGVPGAAGDRGPVGDTGPRGEPGKPGVQGDPGATGEQGDEGTAGNLDTKTLKWLVNKIFIEELNAMGINTPMT